MSIDTVSIQHVYNVRNIYDRNENYETGFKDVRCVKQVAKI